MAMAVQPPMGGGLAVPRTLASSGLATAHISCGSIATRAQFRVSPVAAPAAS